MMISLCFHIVQGAGGVRKISNSGIFERGGASILQRVETHSDLPGKLI
jgi:hypothetical protein